MKKLFIISTVLLCVVLLFLGIYNFAFKKTKTETAIVDQVIEPVKNVAQVIVPEKIIAVSKGSVLGIYFDKKMQAIKYYDAITGAVWKVDIDGEQKISNTNVSGLTSVLWSPEGNKVLTVTKKNEQSAFYMYDYNMQKGTLLKSGLDAVAWDNLGTKILYKYFDAATGERTLNIANPDGSDWKKITDLTVKNLNIASVPLTSQISYWNQPAAAEETQLHVVGTIGGEPRLILGGRYGADYLWSPKGDKALVSSLADKSSASIALGMVSVDGKYQDMNIPTLVSKCVWSADGRTLYYALPGEIPSSAVMPDDYLKNKFSTSDTFWRMDIATGEKQRIIEVNEIKGKYDSSSMVLSDMEDVLYFINKIDQKLYKIQL